MTSQMIAEYSAKIIEWLDTHPAFKQSVMCEALGYDTGNFSRHVKAKKFPKERIPAILHYLSDYGFLSDISAVPGTAKPAIKTTPEKIQEQQEQGKGLAAPRGTIEKVIDDTRKEKYYDAKIPSVSGKKDLEALRDEIIDNPGLLADTKKKLLTRIESKLKFLK